MSEKMTRIRLPNQTDFSGLLDWGEKTPEEMTDFARKYASRLREQAEAIERADDADFQIDVVRGPYVQRHIKELQKSRILSAPSP